MSQAVRSHGGPLAGLSVVDLTQNLAGPFCSMFLADLGAEVVKVEPLHVGDNSRSFGPPFAEGESPGFLTLNRNKRSIAVDLKQPDGRDVLLRLVRQADVFLENFRPGVTDRLGIDEGSLRPLNPRLIYCSISGFGDGSPFERRGGLDLIAQAMSGIMSVTGEPGRPPVKVGVPITDLTAGLMACVAVLGALLHQHTEGQGQRVETSLLDAGLALSVWEASSYLATGERPGPTGSSHRVVAPYQAFPTSDGAVTIGAASQGLWERLCSALSLSRLLTDRRFLDNQSRTTHKDELAELLSSETSKHTSDALIAKLESAGVPCGPIWGYDQILGSEHVAARSMVIQQEHPIAGTVQVLGIPIKFSDSPGSIHSPAPLLGQDTRALLQELGYRVEEIRDLLDRAVCSAP